MKTRIFAKFLAFILLLNSCLYGVYFQSFATELNSNFNWQKTLSLSDTLTTYTRTSSSDEVFLTWNFNKNSSGNEINTATYTLTYNIDDNKQIKFLVEKQNDVAIITYSIKDTSSDLNSQYSNSVNQNSGYQVYKTDTGSYITPNSTSYPEISNDFKIYYNDNGEPTEVKFSITQNNGFSFKYNNNTIKFKWNSDGLFYFSTNGIKQGNIYDFNLSLTNAGSYNYTETLKIFTGINTSTLNVIPIANSGETIIDQTSRPITQYPADDSQIQITFDMPKVWDEATNTYIFQPYDSNPSPMEVVFNLGNSDVTKQIQINIDNIYKDYTQSSENVQLEIINSSTSSQAYAFRNSNSSVTLLISNLDYSTIYDPTTIATEQEGIETVSIDIDFGIFYTYLKYSIVSLGTEDFYIKIQPFNGYNGYYTVKTGYTSSTLSTWSTYEENNYGKESILIPINLSSTNPQTKYFQVEFSLTPPDESSISNNNKFTSQILMYKPSESDIILGTPTNLEVIDTSVIYNIITDKNELITTLKWDMAYENVLKYLIESNDGQPVEITYYFTKGNTPTTSTSQQFAQIKLIISLNDSDINIQIQEVGDNNYIETSEVIKTQVVLGNSTLTVISPSVTFRLPVSKTSENSSYFTYPSINFISINGEYYINSEHIIISSSNSINITIDDVLNFSVPMPQNLNTENILEQSFDLTFSTNNWQKSSDTLYTYKTQFLEKIGLTLSDESIYYNFYISNDKSLLDDLISGENLQDLIITFDYEFQPLSEFNFTSNSYEGKTYREFLREGYIIEIKNVLQTDFFSETQKISFTGLDKNEIYYLNAKTYLIPYTKDTLVKQEQYTDESSFSSIISVTTSSDKDFPTSSEEQPSAPTNFDKQNVTLSSANLLWSTVEEEDSTLEYQFIRIQGDILDQQFLYSTNSFEDTWNSISSSSKFGFKTSGYNLQTYSEDLNSFSNASSDDLEYVVLIGDSRNILDKTLQPNQIYYYYIRTVRVINGEDASYSVWVPLSLTTSNISAPTDLTVLRDEIDDKTSEVVISFKTPVMSIDFFNENYSLKYSIKKDTQSWSKDYDINTNKATFIQNDDGTITVKYTITGLEHNTLYTIRVRIYSSELEVYSDYSNEVTHKTNTDSIQNDYDSIINDWKLSYSNLLEQLINQDYWYITNNLSTTKVLYRPNHIENIITTSSIIELEPGLGGAKREYYIPATEIQKIINAKKGLKIIFGDSEVILPYDSLDFTGNSAYTSILEAINNGYAKDYFVKISATFAEGTYSIDSYTNISPNINISLEFIGTSKSITSFDSYLLDVLQELLDDDFIDNLNTEILELVEDSSLNTEILDFIKSQLNLLISDFGSTILTQISKITRRTYSAQSLNNNIIIAHLVDSKTTANAYFLENYNWKSVQTSTYGSKKAIFTNKLGSYIFVGQTLVISGIGNIENGALITQIIVKYSLEDYLGKDGNIDLNSSLTRNSVIGITSRISGATTSQDPITFFSNKGVTLSNRNLDSNITTQEAIFLLMKAYEFRTNTSLDTIKITNYNLTSNIANLNNIYKKAVQVAFQTGIYTNKNMSANGSITVKEFLQSLANLINKVGL